MLDILNFLDIILLSEPVILHAVFSLVILFSVSGVPGKLPHYHLYEALFCDEWAGNLVGYQVQNCLY